MALGGPRLPRMGSMPGLDAPETIDSPVASETHWAAYDAAGIQRLLAVEDRHFWFRARNLIIAALVGDPGLLPEDHRIQIQAEGLARTAADYIAGMTDSFIEEVWGRCGGL